MTRRFFTIVTGLFLAVSVANAQIQAQTPIASGTPDISGFYLGQGGNAKGDSYKCFTAIDRSGENTYNVVQITLAGDGETATEAILGIGILKGDVLAVNYFDDGDMVMLAVYSIEADGSLNGEYTLLGTESRTFPEILTRTDKMPDIKVPEAAKPPKKVAAKTVSKA